MGLPQIIIDFKSAGTTAVRRSSRGTVALLLAGTGQKVSFDNLSQAQEAGLDSRILRLVRLCFLGNPAKVTVLYDNGDPDTALPLAAAAAQGGWLCAPDTSASTVCSFTKESRMNGSTIRAVVTNAEAPDCEGIVNFTAQGIQVKLDDDILDVDSTDYTARIAGILAGLSLARSATYLALPEVVDFTDQEDPDADIAAGKLILYRGSSRIRLGRAVTSLVTLTADKGSAFQKIKIAEGVDLIRSDIRRVFEENYIGQVLNDYDSKLLLVTAMNGYLQGLEGSVLDPAGDNSVSIDFEAQQQWLQSQGVDTGSMSQVEILKANTGSQVFLSATLRFADAMEDLQLQVSM